MSTRAFTGVLSAESTDQLEAVETALRDYGPEVRQRFQDAARSQLRAGFTDELHARPGFSDLQRVIVSARPEVAVATQAGGMGIVIATGGSGALGDLTKPYEFGTSNREEMVTYSRNSPKGGSHRVTRRTKRQLPTRSQTGWIGYPAAGRLSQRAFAMAMQILVLIGHNATEGKR